jgi:hypothetical protein
MLSAEHSGFRFEKDPNVIAERLQFHSGGKVSKAIAKAFNVNLSGN